MKIIKINTGVQALKNLFRVSSFVNVLNVMLMKPFFSLIIFQLLIVCSAGAQEKPGPFFSALTVSNIDTSISWYSRVLDLKLRNRTDNPERGFKQAVLIRKDIMIELVEVAKTVMHDSLLNSFLPGTRITGVNKIGFRVKNMDAYLDSLLARGYKIYGRVVADPIDKKRTFLIQDPDLNLVQFFEK